MEDELYDEEYEDLKLKLSNQIGVISPYRA